MIKLYLIHHRAGGSKNNYMSPKEVVRKLLLCSHLSSFSLLLT